MKGFDSVICFGDSDWWYHNRGHADMQYMRHFAKRWRVLYVNSLGVKKPVIREGVMFFRRAGRKILSMARYLRQGEDGFTIFSPLYLPVFEGYRGHASAALLWIQLKLVLGILKMQRPLVWIACPSAACILEGFDGNLIVYQLSDCYSAMVSGDPRTLLDLEASVAHKAKLILCSSRKLLNRSRHLYGEGEYVDHGVDFDLFDQASKEKKIPIELKETSRPIIGFFGNLDANTVDLKLVDTVVSSRPKYSFVFVGPATSEFMILKKHPNVIMVPRRPYGEIPSYGASFDVCLMPWLKNKWIEHCNPVKFKEYLALGKPVVSIPFPELEEAPELSYKAIGHLEFAKAIDRALEEDGPERRKFRKEWASRHSWDSKFQKVLDLIISRGITI